MPLSKENAQVLLEAERWELGQAKRAWEQIKLVVCIVAIVCPVCTASIRNPAAGRQRQAACRQPALNSP